MHSPTPVTAAGQRLALALQYAGNAFHGWQTQPGGDTLQDALEAALAAIAAQPIATVCAGRTDAGVHAIAQVVHFDTPVARPASAWVRGVNAHLPKSMSVRWAVAVAPDFHARFSATGRRYRYVLLNTPTRPGLLHGRVGWTHHPLDLARMRQAATYLLGSHDFSAFRAAQCQAQTPVRNLMQAQIRQVGRYFLFEFTANAFLQHMVRNLVGTLVRIGQGAEAPEWIHELLRAADRRQAAGTFMADGLYFLSPIYAEKWGLPPFVDELSESEHELAFYLP